MGMGNSVGTVGEGEQGGYMAMGKNTIRII